MAETEPIVDQCPSCGRISLHWERPPERWTCRAPGCGFACEFEDLRDRTRARRELEWRACRDISSDDLLRMAETPKAGPTPAAHGARLRSMLDPDHPARSLSPADRAAVRWALDELGRLRGERDTACRLERERWERLPDWARGRKDGR